MIKVNNNSEATKRNNSVPVKEEPKNTGLQDLKNNLEEERTKYDMLNEQYQTLEKDYEKVKTDLGESKKKIKELTTQLVEYKTSTYSKILELQESIDMKDLEISELNDKIGNTNEMIFSPEEPMITVGFTSPNKEIDNYSKEYKESEIFSRIEEELYNQFPEFKDKDTYLMLNENKIKRFKSLKENEIKSGDVIEVRIYGEENK